MQKPLYQRLLRKVATAFGVLGAAYLLLHLLAVWSYERHEFEEADPLTNLKEIGLGCLQYEQDHDGRLPKLDSLDAFQRAMYPYVKNFIPYSDPHTKTTFVTNGTLSFAAISQVPSDMILMYDPVPRDGKYAALFADCHAAYLSPFQLQSALIHSRLEMKHAVR